VEVRAESETVFSRASRAADVEAAEGEMGEVGRSKDVEVLFGLAELVRDILVGSACIVWKAGVWTIGEERGAVTAERSLAGGEGTSNSGWALRSWGNVIGRERVTTDGPHRRGFEVAIPAGDDDVWLVGASCTDEEFLVRDSET